MTAVSAQKLDHRIFTSSRLAEFTSIKELTAQYDLHLQVEAFFRRLGHASIKMTADRNGHLFPRQDDDAELAAAESALLGTHAT